MATIISGIAEFKRELIQERIRSGIAAAKARGKRLGRQPAQRPNDRVAPGKGHRTVAGPGFQADLAQHTGEFAHRVDGVPAAERVRQA